jgi:hypothetical protein
MGGMKATVTVSIRIGAVEFRKIAAAAKGKGWKPGAYIRAAAILAAHQNPELAAYRREWLEGAGIKVPA